ncbi:unnamed protein product [Camellia sinensis]
MDKDNNASFESTGSPIVPPESSNSQTNVFPSESKPPKPPNKRKSESSGGRAPSSVWDHFDKVIGEDGKRRAVCKYCFKEYMADSRTHGTSNLRSHTPNCKQFPNNDKDGQQTLSFKSKQNVEEGVEVVATSFSFEACKRALAEMVIIDELPFRFVEGVGFKRFCNVAVALDPTKKIAYLEFCFTNIFHGEKRKVDEMVNKIVSCLTRLYNHYATIYSSNESVSRVTEVETMVIDEDDLDSQMESQFNSYLEGRFTSGSKSELDKYLGEVEHFAKNQTFEILEYWKNNATKYRVLSQIAKDVLAMPISTVASESAFSTGGRILDPFRSSLAPSMVEALVCTQNWLKSNLPISLRQAMDDVEEFEQYDSDCWMRLDIGRWT